MTELEKALKKIDQEDITYGTPEYTLRQLVAAWLEYAPDDAAAKVMDAKKNIKGCYMHIRKCAAGLGAKEVNAAPEKEVEWMLGYYGVPTETATVLIEGGLMYAVFMAIGKSWKKYGQPEDSLETKKMDPEPAMDVLDLSGLL